MKTCSALGCPTEIHPSGNRSGLCAKHWAQTPERKAQKATTERAWWTANRDRLRESEAARARQWAEDNPDRVRDNHQIRRARKQKLFVERVFRTVLFTRDSGVCHICLHQVGRDFVVEHVIPLVLGGPHCYANTAVAHSWCNRSKGVRAFSSDPQRWLEALTAYQTMHGRALEATESNVGPSPW